MTDQKQARDQQELLDLLRRHLTEQFCCHTAILYGSRARGDWDAASDIDVIAFCDAGEAGHVAHRWHDLYLDLFLYPTATKAAPDWLRLHGGRVLFQRGSDGDEVLAAVEGMLAAGPERLSADDARTQGRRMRSAGDHGGHEVVVPGGGFALALEARLQCRIGAREVECNLT